MRACHENEGAAPPAYVVFGGPPYETRANQTSMQMFQSLAKEHPALYVSRRFQGSIVRRLLRGALGKSTTELKPGLRRLNDHGYLLVLPRLVDWLPLVIPAWSRSLAMVITKRAILRSLRSLNWKDPVIISYWWMFPEIVALPLWKARIFDVIDRHWGYAHLVDEAAQRSNICLTVQTAAASDGVYTVSEALAEELARQGVTAAVLPNAIDLDRVKLAAGSVETVRENLAVYAGGWNERLDIELVEALVRRNPTWRFAFLGTSPVKRFSEYANVEFLGDVSYGTVLSVLHNAKIGLIPFLVNEFTEASNFLKVLDYLACGVEVGATKISNLQAWADRHPSRFRICSSIEDWDQLFRSAEEMTPEATASKPLNLEDNSTTARAKVLTHGVLRVE